MNTENKENTSHDPIQECTTKGSIPLLCSRILGPQPSTEGRLVPKKRVLGATLTVVSGSKCHLAHISVQLGGAHLKWDPDKEKFIGNDAADKLTLRGPMRTPWKLE